MLTPERTRTGRVGDHPDLKRIVSPVVYHKHINRLRVLRLVLVGQEYVEACARWVSRALNRVSGLVLDGERRCGSVALSELHIVGAVLECAAAVFGTGFAFRVGPCEYRDVDLVAADAHLYRNIQIP